VTSLRASAASRAPVGWVAVGSAAVGSAGLAVPVPVEAERQTHSD
jgi:hypothetical protein